MGDTTTQMPDGLDPDKERLYQAECTCGWISTWTADPSEAGCLAVLHQQMHEEEDNEKS